MALKERIFLFHGNDTWASSRAVTGWEAAFLAKYGAATRYRFEADELDLTALTQQLEAATAVQSLFPVPTLCVLRRPTANERGRAGAVTQALLTILNQAYQRADPLLTVAIWDDHQLSERHPLVQWFREHSAHAAERVSSVPHQRDLILQGEAYLTKQGYTLAAGGRQYLESRLLAQEKEQRLAKRLRMGEVLASDYRTWWLYGLLDAALILVSENNVTVDHLRAVDEPEHGVVGVFEIVNACTNGQWARARQLLRQWEEAGVDEGNYFGLSTLLRQQYRRQGDHYALTLLADVELMSKNGLLTQVWLADEVVQRLAEHARTGQSEPLVSPRILWLAAVGRA